MFRLLLSHLQAIHNIETMYQRRAWLMGSHELMLTIKLTVLVKNVKICANMLNGIIAIIKPFYLHHLRH